MSNELTPLVAGIGYNDGANGGFWRVQPRQKTGDGKGQWIEMGAEIRAYFKDALGKAAAISGRAIGSDGTPDGVRVLIQGQADKGIPDGIYRFKTKHVRVAEALLTDEYLESQGISTTVPGDIDLADLPSIDDLERADITSDDIRLVNEGINSPEGQEMSKFKETPEGQAEAAKAPEESGDTTWGASVNHEKAVSDAWEEAYNGGTPDLDSMILEAKGPTKKLFDLNPGDKIVSKSGEVHTYVSSKPIGAGKSEITVTKDADGSTAKFVVPSNQDFTLAPKGDTPTPEPKQENMSTRQLDKMDKLKAAAEKIGNLDPQLEKDLSSLYKRIEDLDVIGKAEADDMIGRLQKHVSDSKIIDNTPKKEPVAAPEIVRKDRPDNGQDIALPDTPESELKARKVLALRDSEGNRVRQYDPETGEVKSTFAEDPDSIMNALLEEYPDAVWTEDGALLVERSKFQDPDGTERQIESLIRRTDGNNYMIGYRITEPDGTVNEYYSHDYRDSFSSIHGTTNGIMRMSAILKGDLPEDFLPTARRKNSAEWKLYFGTGRFEDRLKHFRGKYKSKVTEETLKNNLAKANASGREDEIALAQYNLDLLNNDFNGDIEKYRANATVQQMRLITMDETIDKYSNGRFRVLNGADSTVLKSTVSGIYGSIKDGDKDSVAQGFKELRGRLPSMVQNPEIAQKMLDRVRAGIKERFPSANQRTLNANITNGYNLLTTDGAYSTEALDSAPHVSWDGQILRKHMLVEYTNSEGDKSVGIVTKLIPSERPGTGGPQQYDDYVSVVFKGDDGKIVKRPVRLASKQLKVLDDTGITQDALDSMTIYTPNIKGEAMRRARFGDRYLMQQRSKYTDLFPGGSDNIGDGRNPAIKDPSYYNTDTLAPGDYLYDKDGLPIGQIAGVRETKSDSGEAGYTFAHVDTDGNIGFTAVKAGETRAPKQDMTKDDPKGSSESDPGFIPNPEDFSDAGFTPESISSDFASPDDALQNLVETQGAENIQLVASSLANLIALNNAKAAYAKDNSDTNRDLYKAALTTYYTELAKYKAASAKHHNLDYAPGSVLSDDILSPEDLAKLNAKIAATHRPFSKSDKTGSLPNMPTFDEIYDSRVSGADTYSGPIPKNWKVEDPAQSIEKQLASIKEYVSAMTSMFIANPEADQSAISDSLMDAVTKLQFVNNNVDKNRQISANKFHEISGPNGDTIKVLRTADKNGYVAAEKDVNAVAEVIDDLHSRLNIGKPINYSLIDSNEARTQHGADTALGFAYLGTMNGHTVVDRIDRFIDGLKNEQPYDPTNSWFATDLQSNPEDARKYVLYHEIGHLLEGIVWPDMPSAAALLRMRSEYAALARTYISNYGRSNLHEHFAETMARWGLTGQADPKFIQFLINHGILVPSGN